jgi:hypothetical protein
LFRTDILAPPPIPLGVHAADMTTPDEPVLPEATFDSIIRLHHLQALLHLGLLPHPATGQPLPLNLAVARRELAVLELLRDKTRGNLTPAEGDLLEEVLTSLAMACANASEAAREAEALAPPKSAVAKAPPAGSVRVEKTADGRRRLVLPGDDDA